jgi:hypothetical protein
MRQGDNILSRNFYQLGVPAIDVQSDRSALEADVILSLQAILASTAGQPGDHGDGLSGLKSL